MIVIFTEEKSMRVAIESLMASHFPELVQGWHWFTTDFNGKSGLEANFPERMRSWNYGNPLFIIMRDADGADCHQLKDRLAQLAASAPGKRHKIRIVCQELESWFLGDSDAVCKAFPRCAFSNKTTKFRDPDRLTNASQELAGLTGIRGKVARAEAISKHLDPSTNRSHSFKLFFKTIAEAVASRS